MHFIDVTDLYFGTCTDFRPSVSVTQTVRFVNRHKFLFLLANMDPLQSASKDEAAIFHAVSIPKRYIRDYDNPVEFYSEAQFRLRFRFTKENILHVIMPLFGDKLKKKSKRGLPIPPLITVLVALRYYATGSFQTVCGDMHFVSPPTICRIILHVSTILSGLLSQHVKLPARGLESHAVRRAFYDIGAMPDIVGCIDCTHIPISNPGGDAAEIYRNRNSYFSINVQVVGGPNLEIFDIVARWPGREQDSRIFYKSSVKIKFQEGVVEGKLLGDSAYGCETYLLTPIINPTPGSPEERYNKAQIKTRSTVERLFGVWKRRFPCLSKSMANKLNRVPKIIIACAVLHNVAIKCKDPINNLAEDVMPMPQPENALPITDDMTGLAFRRAFIIRHFY